MKERFVRELLSSFPYPISSVFIKLRTDECLDPGPLRLKYILATAEAVGRFLGMLALCECREALEQGKVTPAKALSADFETRLKRPSWGVWLHNLRESVKLLRGAEFPLVVEELPDFLFNRKGKPSESAAALDQLLNIRNKLSHEKIKAMHAHEFKALCEETFPLLEGVLEDLDFLMDYELYFVNKVEVEKRRRSQPDYRHRYKRVSGSSDAFEGVRRSLDFTMEFRSVVMVSVEDGKRHLSLDPMLVYEEEAGKAPDVFFFNGMKNSAKVEYAACNHGGAFNSADSQRAQNIQAEIEHILSLFTPEIPPSTETEAP